MEASLPTVQQHPVYEEALAGTTLPNNADCSHLLLIGNLPQKFLGLWVQLEARLFGIGNEGDGQFRLGAGSCLHSPAI